MKTFIKEMPIAVCKCGGFKMKKENPELIELIRELKVKARENNARIWRDIATRLEAPTRNHSEVNVSKLQRYANDGEYIVVPGKLLGSGTIDKKLTVAAWKFSKKAEEKITKAGGRVISISDMIRENPKGSNIRIMG